MYCLTAAELPLQQLVDIVRLPYGIGCHISSSARCPHHGIALAFTIKHTWPTLCEATSPGDHSYLDQLRGIEPSHVVRPTKPLKLQQADGRAGGQAD
jgi:hypothetical protein